MKPVLFPSAYLSHCFSDDYAQAHKKFSELSSRHDEIDSYRELVLPETGPEGEALATAVAWQGPADASRVLVLQSATHGVEGFTGSAIQLDTLNWFYDSALPADTAVLYIHAINPHGFAWLRRVNEQGVDLNRNFVDFDQPLPQNSGYAELAQYLVPLNMDNWQSATQHLEDYRVQHGQQAYEMAVSGGQYEFAEGLFYGGVAPSRSRLNLEQIIDDYKLADRQSVAVIDVHTGLGSFAYGEVICDHPPGSLGVQLARRWFGGSVTEPLEGSSTSVPKDGLIDYLWHRKLGDRVCFVTLEYGTYSVGQMFEALRRDHYLHRSTVDWSSSESRSVKQAIRQFFYPATSDWQEMVLIKGRQCVRQALQGLTDE